ncbi:L-2-amino-thiazoline-4-carboxylic acid hydrolase [Desulfosporosinus sp. BICA1-9]|uniref:L-2-amino-thiazoline-4-carboxylic acid hydrolase n=1 Tax=Desulfosporosinus sp. BICA1-9 TaxID=1531958 RepID=UPI00054BD133|nr:L-2-amino-thiazoline-4-carboxylic acid hydrolase [Desulfosporosinus sp. BICA1-9]KJS48442.1 MAG: hypothetical protein VR66_13880 [Peptococcaceae bacterium BRH_c23]KJS78242.1 MAG: hypothetical protein JL57_32050 [Desulfosporosinus sp. BICA1-9]
MSEINADVIKKLERDWRSMIFISHDFFHRWRMVLEEKFGAEETVALVDRFWESVGEGTAESYLKRGRDTADLEQIVNAFVRASLVMGESAKSVKEGNDVLLIHDSCPWVGSYKDYGAPGQCQAGCDKWFETALKAISQDFTVQTDSCMAAGESTCTRRYSRKNNG